MIGFCGQLTHCPAVNDSDYFDEVALLEASPLALFGIEVGL